MNSQKGPDVHERAKNIQLSGRGISPGLGMGTAHIYHDVLQRVESVYCLRSDNDVDEECQRLERAIDEVLADLERGEKDVNRTLDEDFARIFRVHREMLKDRSVRDEMLATIRKTRVNAECVVSGVFRRLEGQFRQSDDARMAERADDVRDLSRRVLSALAGQTTREVETLPENTVIVATRLLPSDTVHFSRQSVSAVVVEQGGPTSHAAILTRELGIPAISGIESITRKIPAGHTVLVNGTEGTAIIAPDQTVTKAFQHRQNELKAQEAVVREQARTPATTRDDQHVTTLANISCREDTKLAAEYGADGVGLYRIEHLYFGRDGLPDEDDLIDSIQATLAAFDTDVPVTLRLLDTGGDKPLPFLDHPTESTPLLGRRGVRFLLDFPDLLVTQLRAFIRLASLRQVRVLVPMVTLPSDMLAVRNLYEQAAKELRCDQPPPLGSMIETPAAALCAESIAEVSDFLSAGTNDLTQYTMAAGRENTHVTDYFLQDHPAVFRLLENTVRASGDKPCSVCGELAGRPDATPKLLSLGIREVSVNPIQIPRIKQAIREVDLQADETLTKDIVL
ncbi:MAG: phosphoenolpyruvate--protein phosphotransferase [Phycisphaerae bacterium]